MLGENDCAVRVADGVGLLRATAGPASRGDSLHSLHGSIGARSLELVLLGLGFSCLLLSGFLPSSQGFLLLLLVQQLQRFIKLADHLGSFNQIRRGLPRSLRWLDVPLDEVVGDALPPLFVEDLADGEAGVDAGLEGVLGGLVVAGALDGLGLDSGLGGVSLAHLCMWWRGRASRLLRLRQHRRIDAQAILDARRTLEGRSKDERWNDGRPQTLHG